KRAFGEQYIPGWTRMPGVYYRDALVVGLGGASAILGLRTVILTVAPYWPTSHRAVDAAFGGNFDAVLPGAAILAGAMNHSLLFAGLVAVLASFIAGYVRPVWLRALVYLLAALAIIGPNWGSPADLLKQWLAQLILLGVLAGGVRWVMRFNVLGCFLAIALLALIEPASGLLSQPDHFYRLNGYAVVAASLLLLLWPLTAWRLAPATGNREPEVS